MRTSILQIVTPDLAEVASGMDASETARLTAAAERVTLLSRRAKGHRRELRYHPLVREFLEARLTRDYGIEAVRTLHRTVGDPRRGTRLADRGPPLLGGGRPASSARDHRRRGPEHHRPRRLPRRGAVRRPGGRGGPARELPRGALATRLQARRHPRRPVPRQTSRRIRPRLGHRPREPGVIDADSSATRMPRSRLLTNSWRDRRTLSCAAIARGTLRPSSDSVDGDVGAIGDSASRTGHEQAASRSDALRRHHVPEPGGVIAHARPGD